MNLRSRTKQGFTLIELSIVLVIIGLIIGGVLVGQDLVSAAAARATLAQVEKYNSAAHTFQTKYGGYLPGDITSTYATQFGFPARGQYAGEGDGNGLIEGIFANAANSNGGWCETVGETTMFWVDLSTAKMIDGNFNTATATIIPPTNFTVTNFFPPARMGQGNYFYVWSGGPGGGAGWTGPAWGREGLNYFGLSAVSSIGGCSLNSTPGLSVAQAYNLDKKVDDGYPQNGSVTAQYLSYAISANAGATPAAGGGVAGAAGTSATASSSTTCYDNGGAGGTQKYSMEVSNGSGVNCALSFQMQ